MIVVLLLAVISLLRVRTTFTLTGRQGEHNVFIMVMTIMNLFVVPIVFLLLSALIIFVSFVKELSYKR